MTAPAGWPDDYAWPTCHPTTGEPFVEGNFSIERQTKRVHASPPSPPSRWTCDYVDDDGTPINERELSAEEFTEATAAYEKAAAEYRRTGGLHILCAGPNIVSATFTTATGSIAEATWNDQGRSWRWDRADGPAHR